MPYVDVGFDKTKIEKNFKKAKEAIAILQAWKTRMETNEEEIKKTTKQIRDLCDHNLGTLKSCATKLEATNKNDAKAIKSIIDEAEVARKYIKNTVSDRWPDIQTKFTNACKSVKGVEVISGKMDVDDIKPKDVLKLAMDFNTFVKNFESRTKTTIESTTRYYVRSEAEASAIYKTLKANSDSYAGDLQKNLTKSKVLEGKLDGLKKKAALIVKAATEAMREWSDRNKSGKDKSGKTCKALIEPYLKAFSAQQMAYAALYKQRFAIGDMTPDDKKRWNEVASNIATFNKQLNIAAAKLDNKAV